MTESETEDVQQLRQCLSRSFDSKTFHLDDIHPRAMRGQLDCHTPVSFETVRSMLLQFDTVWFHGDSIMGQVFYSLSCMLNSTIEWNSTRIMEQHGLRPVGLGKSTYEQFTYRHDAGITTFIYSRFGQIWKFDDNLFRYDFPEAVRTLSSSDALVTNAAAVHYDPDHGTNFSEIADFIAAQSLLTNATFFWFEPTPQEWATVNGMYTRGIDRPTAEVCNCAVLTDAQLMGTEDTFLCIRAQAVYKAMRGNASKVPKSVPNSWRTDVVRSAVEKVNHNKIHLVPIYWQLVSREGGSSLRDGDCTHKDIYSIINMIYQWAR